MAVNPSSTPTSSYLLLLIQSIKRLNLIPLEITLHITVVIVKAILTPECKDTGQVKLMQDSQTENHRFIFYAERWRKQKQKQSLRKYTDRGHNKDQMQEMYIDAESI